MRLLLAAAVFLFEIAALAGLAVLGWSVDGPVPARLLMALLLPVVGAAFWGFYLSPRARRPLTAPWRLALRALVLLCGAAGFAAGGHTVLAWVMVAGAFYATIVDGRLGGAAGR